jgi:hypothetical protein
MNILNISSRVLNGSCQGLTLVRDVGHTDSLMVRYMFDMGCYRGQLRCIVVYFTLNVNQLVQQKKLQQERSQNTPDWNSLVCFNLLRLRLCTPKYFGN